MSNLQGASGNIGSVEHHPHHHHNHHHHQLHHQMLGGANVGGSSVGSNNGGGSGGGGLGSNTIGARLTTCTISEKRPITRQLSCLQYQQLSSSQIRGIGSDKSTSKLLGLEQIESLSSSSQLFSRSENQTSNQQQLQQTQPATSMASYQQKHALHRLRRLKKRSPHRDLVISFVPRLRTSIFNRLDFFYRYSKQEQEVLSCFDFLDELSDVKTSSTNHNHCDQTATTNSLDSPRCSQKLYESLINELL